MCSTPRSGSGLLCRGLAATGAAGTPLEYFNPVHRERLAARWGCAAGLGDYVACLYRLRTTHAGVFSAKVHWDQLQALAGEARGDPLAALFPGAVYVRIRRRDRDRQAVSLWRAMHDGIWSVAECEPMPGERAAVPYSFEGIARCRGELAEADAAWDAYLAAPRHRPRRGRARGARRRLCRGRSRGSPPSSPARARPRRRLPGHRHGASPTPAPRRSPGGSARSAAGYCPAAWQTSPSGSPRGRSS